MHADLPLLLREEIQKEDVGDYLFPNTDVGLWDTG